MMEQKPVRAVPQEPDPPSDPRVRSAEVDTLAKKMEDTRRRVEALERDVAEVIADRRAGAE